MSSAPPGRSARRRLVAAARLDLEQAARSVVVDTLLGSALVPRPLRWLGYRAVGARIRTQNIFPGAVIAGPTRHLHIGAGTFVNRRAYFETVAPIRIGRDCQLGPQVMIITSHHEITDEGVARTRTGRGVVIGDRVWLGARVTVLPGVTIADDVIIGAGAVVARDCGEPGLWAGVPARLVRPRTAAAGVARP